MHDQPHTTTTSRAGPQAEVADRIDGSRDPSRHAGNHQVLREVNERIAELAGSNRTAPR